MKPIPTPLNLNLAALGDLKLPAGRLGTVSPHKEVVELEEKHECYRVLQNVCKQDVRND